MCSVELFTVIALILILKRFRILFWYTTISNKEKQPDAVGAYKVILQPDMVMRRSLIKSYHSISLPEVSFQKSIFTADPKFMKHGQRPQFIFVPEEDAEYKALSAYKKRKLEIAIIRAYLTDVATTADVVIQQALADVDLNRPSLVSMLRTYINTLRQQASTMTLTIPVLDAPVQHQHRPSINNGALALQVDTSRSTDSSSPTRPHLHDDDVVEVPISSVIDEPILAAEMIVPSSDDVMESHSDPPSPPFDDHVSVNSQHDEPNIQSMEQAPIALDVLCDIAQVTYSQVASQATWSLPIDTEDGQIVEEVLFLPIVAPSSHPPASTPITRRPPQLRSTFRQPRHDRQRSRSPSRDWSPLHPAAQHQDNRARSDSRDRRVSPHSDYAQSEVGRWSDPNNAEWGTNVPRQQTSYPLSRSRRQQPPVPFNLLTNIVTRISADQILVLI
jgi:hypothetical protein